MGVERYLSPVSGKIATMIFPLFSGRFASCEAAQTAAPDEIPTSKPSCLASVLPVANASSYKPRADALNLMRSGLFSRQDRRAGRLNGDDLNIRVLIL